jgi:hypothetical protein
MNPIQHLLMCCLLFSIVVSGAIGSHWSASAIVRVNTCFVYAFRHNAACVYYNGLKNRALPSDGKFAV